MTEQSFFRNRLYLTAGITIAVGSLLIWGHFNGGVPSHHIFNKKSLPEVSNWWGGLLLPLLTWFLTYRIQKRVFNGVAGGSNMVKFPAAIIYRFFFAFLFGLAIALLYTFRIPNISTYMIVVLLTLALLFPIYRAECLLGFVLGMTYTFGAILPTGTGAILVLFSLGLYAGIRPVLIFIVKRIKALLVPRTAST